jgi:BioD-like phosphotransacetylase family protein
MCVRFGKGNVVLTLCLCSIDSGAGKSTQAIAVGKRLIRSGYRIEYVSTVEGAPAQGHRAHDESSHFVRAQLDLGPPVDSWFPVALSTALVAESRDAGNPGERLRALRDGIAGSVDVFLVECGGSLMEGAMLGISAPEVVRLLEARALVVAAYSGELMIDSVLGTQRLLGNALVGAVITSIPQAQLAPAQRTVQSLLERRGLRILGMLPEDRLLASVTVGELAIALDGRFLCCAEQQGALVEHLMVGAMGADHALAYFQRQSAKAVVTGGDRPAIQLAALETATRCLILTGNLAPDAEVLARAQELQVPLIMVDLDTLTAIERAQALFAQSRLLQEKKIKRLLELFDRYFDFASLFSALRLPTRPS